MARWVGLLRGVNVGGGNRLPMSELRASVTAAGFTDVLTYIQSGNLVVDDDRDDDEPAIVQRLRDVLVGRHGLSVPVVVRPADEIARIGTAHPAAGTIDPKLLHVLFLDRAPDEVADAGGPAALDPTPFAPDTWSVAGREVYVTYPNGSGRSKLTIDVFERAWSVTATARNLNTVRELARLSGGR